MAKPVEYDPHAVQRMQSRGFSASDVEWILESGTPADPGPVSYQEPRHARERMIRGQLARVIFLENEERYYVITVFWVTSGGRR